MSPKRSTRPKMKKTSTKQKSSKLTESLEKEFRSIPAKLSALYRNEIAGLKQREKKLSDDLKKAEARKQMAKKKSEIIAKKGTPAAKKQLAAAKKHIKKAHDLVSNLSTQIQEVNKLRKGATAKHAKFAGIKIQLSKIEKQVDTKVKKPKRAKTQKKVKPFKMTIPPQPVVVKTEEPVSQPQEFPYSDKTKDTNRHDF